MPLIQESLRQYGHIYLQNYGDRMPTYHKKALYALMNCRSKNLGGEVYYCNTCQ
jgi:hypothetical protein